MQGFIFLLQKNTTPDLDSLFETSFDHDEIKHETNPKRIRS